MRDKVFWWGDENALKLHSGVGCTTLNILKNTDLYILNEWNAGTLNARYMILYLKAYYI